MRQIQNSSYGNGRLWIGVYSLAADKNLAGEGYRWVTVNGPYACGTEQEVQRITTHHTDATELQMVEDGGHVSVFVSFVTFPYCGFPTSGSYEEDSPPIALAL